MNGFFKNYKLRLSFLWLLIAIFTLSSCNDEDLEIQQDFPFEIEVMPLPGEIAQGETVEIRMTIQRTGNFSDAAYYIRHFQFDGLGTLQYSDNPPYLPNDLYRLPSEQFRLYYTSQCTVSQSFDIWISDNFGNERQLSFKFNNRK